jgi:hypothetical protein
LLLLSHPHRAGNKIVTDNSAGSLATMTSLLGTHHLLCTMGGICWVQAGQKVQLVGISVWHHGHSSLCAVATAATMPKVIPKMPAFFPGAVPNVPQ